MSKHNLSEFEIEVVRAEVTKLEFKTDTQRKS